MKLTETQQQILKGLICPYCKKPSRLIDSKEIYHGTSYGMAYICKTCDAYVGCHKGTEVALGRLANESLRSFKQQAHQSFDAIWKSKKLTRSQAYSWLSTKLNIPQEYTHIGMFSPVTCARAIGICKQFMDQ